MTPFRHRMLNPTSEPICWKPDGISSQELEAQGLQKREETGGSAVRLGEQRERARRGSRCEVRRECLADPQQQVKESESGRASEDLAEPGWGGKDPRSPRIPHGPRPSQHPLARSPHTPEDHAHSLSLRFRIWHQLVIGWTSEATPLVFPPASRWEVLRKISWSIEGLVPSV